jgi:hypothetical protein
MNLIEFNEILSQPDQIKKGQIEGLREITEQYPYFQVAHYLHLKGLKKRRSFKYNDHLKIAAAYTTDRSLLFDNITSDDLDINPAPVDLIAKENDQPKEKEADAIEEHKSVEAPIEKSSSPEEVLKVGQPLEFKSDETFSFREWLQLSNYEPIDRSSPSQLRDMKPAKKQANTPKKAAGDMDLIDKFIATSPKINPSLYDSYTDAAMDSVQENESLMTETLAHVYVEQKKYKKAITAFTILSLKYPEKSSFFAHQIQAIKKLQEK